MSALAPWQILLEIDNHLLDLFNEIDAAHAMITANEDVPLAFRERLTAIQTCANNAYFELDVALEAVNDAGRTAKRLREQRNKAIAAYRALLEEFETFTDT